jgi:mono/diheme cytochrome c family protein
MTRSQLWWAIGLWGLTGSGCGRPGGPYAYSKSEFPVPDAGTPISMVTPPPPQCTMVRSSDQLPPRSTLLDQSGAQAGPQTNIELTSDLYGLFSSVCGGCHVEQPLGGFSVTETTFPMLMTKDVYNNQIHSDDPTQFMPPPTGGGIPFSQRQPSDAVYQLATQIKLWLDQGSSPSSFTLPTPAGAATMGYAMSPALGGQLTNLGSCVADKAMVGTNTTAMSQLDAMFAQATQTTLPPTLDQTDLTSLDSATLAQNGVISFAPAYPLWSDNAQKMRYVRVPQGQSIVFDKAAQEFRIPPNTRFYKTFLKEVIDANGNSTYRKIETRLIVSRPDTTLADGTAQQNAIFGTYVWNDDESQASLLTNPLRDGKPFADRIFTYVTDEQKAQPIIASNPSNLEAALDNAHITRHYAIPGSERCIQCHMGSPSQSFVLGFRPVQIARRATGTGGVYETAVGDELTQLQRFIDYGLITGITSPAEVLPLELSEGTRTPRNVQELNAQAYMVGNCAHCHNPRGYPSVRQPAVGAVLDFLPGPGSNQGIFQFPLETYSPIRHHGLNQDVPIAYITPSLYDISTDEVTFKAFCPDQDQGACLGTNSTPEWILAPWRSLIYRNVDTPYDYFDDYTLYPHMPLDTSGYDCRVKQIMGDWMVSIPARQKDPSKPQYTLPDDNLVFPPNANTDPQPYVEAFPGDSDYAASVGGAAARLDQYHNSFRYDFCPPQYTADIIDPFIQSQADANQTIQPDVNLVYSQTDPSQVIMPVLTPLSPHYVSFDDTDPPGGWYPRRPDWDTALVNANVTSFINEELMNNIVTTDGAIDLTNVLNALPSITLDANTRATLLQKEPFGLWNTSVPGCNYSGEKTASSFLGPNQPQWMTVAPPAPNAPVVVESAGAAVFTTVCFNCHGLQADSQGLLADEITTLTGGAARVANLRDGLLGPLSQPGGNREMIFGADAATLGITADDLGGRYVAWMTLGGTAKHLPQEVLTAVAQSPVIGVVRSNIPLSGTPDMLKLGLSICEEIASAQGNQTPFTLAKFVTTGRMGWSDTTGLVDQNGDAEMWLKLCNLNNRPIVRVPSISWTAKSSASDLAITGQSLYWGAGPKGEDWYGQNPVMDERGNLHQGLTADNMFPICVRQPTDSTQLPLATAWLQANPVLGASGPTVIPFCPKDFVQDAYQLVVNVSGATNDYQDARNWAARGAINAALAVFLYLDEIERDPTQRQPLYNQCPLSGGSN